ncbi:alpha/beta-hydrolase [Xylaria bambusicola]|uniref:alpha/beta-hydrolase n=1 Tax=Xylaria bambusicola TaxID=326684 RepID=UPI0020073E78|nr:alpha/beta-hydrolase [Xylaria bambusicola]KAI0506645.1 alpha/beta-hydrolase [Xylaria bambusicola]
MAAPVKPAILVVSGGWHIPQSYAKLREALEEAGFEVHIPPLTSVKQDEPLMGDQGNRDLDSDTAAIRAKAEELINKDERTVVALMHSYGGHVGSNALHGLGLKTLPDGRQVGVSHLVYLTAYAMPPGGIMMDMVKDQGNLGLAAERFPIEADGTCMCADPKELLVTPGPEDDMKEIEEYIQTLRPWNAVVMTQETKHAAWQEIPAAFIYTTKDMILPSTYQQTFMATLKTRWPEMKTFELVAGHSPNLTASKGVADAVRKIISG